MIGSSIDGYEQGKNPCASYITETFKTEKWREKKTKKKYGISKNCGETIRNTTYA